MISEFESLYSRYPLLVRRDEYNNMYIGFNSIKSERPDEMLFIINIDYNTLETEVLGKK